MTFIAVDDEPFALKDLEEALCSAAAGVEIVPFSRPQDALAFALQNPIEVAFLDIEMYGMSGLELAKALKDIQAGMNIVFVTGYTQYAVDAFSLYASGYILKPISPGAVESALGNLRNPIALPRRTGLRIQTFGNFEVFLDEKPLHFSRSKAKEMLAYLIHKRGTGCTSREFASVLFESRPYTLSLQRQVQTVFSALRKTLKEAGAEDILIKGFNNTSVDIAKVECDYYRFLNWDPRAVNEYMGEYMAGYSWAEFTIGYLDSKVL